MSNHEWRKCKSCSRVTLVINRVSPDPDWVNRQLKSDLEFSRSENQQLQENYHRLWDVGSYVAALYIECLVRERDKTGALVRPNVDVDDPAIRDILSDLLESQRINGEPVNMGQALETAAKILNEDE